MLTSQPIVVLLFISVDFFLLFFYLLAVFRSKKEEHQFVRAHSELIREAKEEIVESGK